MDADEIIRALGLAPHPEGGWFRETWRAEAPAGGREPGSAIFFLLKAGEKSHWHRVDAAEIWHFHAGFPLEIRISQDDAGPASSHLLGADLTRDQLPQVVVPAHAWQSAYPKGGFALVSCTVSPGFRYEGFELAPPGFDIPL